MLLRPPYMFPYTMEQSAKACNEKKVTKKKFDAEEDIRLIKLVQKYGCVDWATISSQMPGRTQRQCRERYKNYLSPNLNNSPWTSEEDNILIKKYQAHGPKWSVLAQYFPGRSDINLRNRVASIMHHMNRPPSKTDSKTEVIQMIDNIVYKKEDEHVEQPVVPETNFQVDIIDFPTFELEEFPYF